MGNPFPESPGASPEPAGRCCPRPRKMGSSMKPAWGRDHVPPPTSEKLSTAGGGAGAAALLWWLSANLSRAPRGLRSPWRPGPPCCMATRLPTPRLGCLRSAHPYNQPGPLTSGAAGCGWAVPGTAGCRADSSHTSSAVTPPPSPKGSTELGVPSPQTPLTASCPLPRSTQVTESFLQPFPQAPRGPLHEGHHGVPCWEPPGTCHRQPRPAFPPCALVSLMLSSGVLKLPLLLPGTLPTPH